MGDQTKSSLMATPSDLNSFAGDMFWLLGAKSHDGHRFLPFALKTEESIDLFCDIGPLTATVKEDGHSSLSIRVEGVICSGLGCLK